MFPGRTATLAVLAGCSVLAAGIYLWSYCDAAIFGLGAVAGVAGCALAKRRARSIPRRPAGPGTPDGGLLESAAEEVKQALHTISGFSGIIADWALREGAEWRISCDHLVEATRQLSLFTSQLHDYARFERGALRLHEQQVDAAELVEAALDACEDEAVRANAYITARLASGAELRCDAPRLRQAITSLVLWVVEASPPGSVIDVVLQPTSGKGLEVRIFNPSGLAPDAGHGDPFELRTPLHGLNSLALPIASRVTLLHGGVIRVEAAQGGGASAFLSLPAQRVDWPDAAKPVPPRAA